MIVMIKDGGRTMALNLDNVASIDFDAESATVYFNVGMAVEGAREGTFVFQPDMLRLGAEAAKYLYRVLDSIQAKPPYGSKYPGTEGEHGR